MKKPRNIWPYLLIDVFFHDNYVNSRVKTHALLNANHKFQENILLFPKYSPLNSRKRDISVKYIMKKKNVLLAMAVIMTSQYAFLISSRL